MQTAIRPLAANEQGIKKPSPKAGQTIASGGTRGDHRLAEGRHLSHLLAGFFSCTQLFVPPQDRHQRAGLAVRLTVENSIDRRLRTANPVANSLFAEFGHRLDLGKQLGGS